MPTKKKKAVDRRIEILEHARALLLKDGARALTLRGVANAVGLKLASVQYYFPTHADLIEALVAGLYDQQKHGLDELQHETYHSAEERLEAVLKWFVYNSSDSQLDQALEVQFWALAQIDEAAKEAMARYHELYVSFLAKLIQKATGISKAKATGRAVSIACLLEGSVLFLDLAAESAPGYGRYKDVLESARLLAYGNQST